MNEQVTLETYLAGWDVSNPENAAAAGAVRAIADAAADIAHRVACGPLIGDLSAAVGEDKNGSGELQVALDVWANDRLISALKAASVASIASEELQRPLHLDSKGQVAVALDPLDGSSNIDTNVAIGTIFSVLPVKGKGGSDALFLQPGSAQIAAGYVIYGPRCALVLTRGRGTQVFTLDPLTRQFWQTAAQVTIPQSSNEYAINASNYRHWSDNVRSYIDDCIAGTEGPRGENVNMRWIASLVAECHRILVRGGVFLYPRDARKGYQNGRLRLVYEANPIAFLVQQAGGKAFDGVVPILDLQPTDIHERTPLIFGSAVEVDRVARYKADPNRLYERSPLFKKRGLLRV